MFSCRISHLQLHTYLSSHLIILQSLCNTISPTDLPAARTTDVLGYLHCPVWTGRRVIKPLHSPKICVHASQRGTRHAGPLLSAHCTSSTKYSQTRSRRRHPLRTLASHTVDSQSKLELQVQIISNYRFYYQCMTSPPLPACSGGQRTQRTAPELPMHQRSEFCPQRAFRRESTSCITVRRSKRTLQVRSAD